MLFCSLIVAHAQSSRTNDRPKSVAKEQGDNNDDDDQVGAFSPPSSIVLAPAIDSSGRQRHQEGFR
jgi:hypothetical protein